MFATCRSAFGTDNVRCGPASLGSSHADMFRSVRGQGANPAARLYACDTYDEHQYATVRCISQYRYATAQGYLVRSEAQYRYWWWFVAASI